MEQGSRSGDVVFVAWRRDREAWASPTSPRCSGCSGQARQRCHPARPRLGAAAGRQSRRRARRSPQQAGARLARDNQAAGSGSQAVLRLRRILTQGGPGRVASTGACEEGGHPRQGGVGTSSTSQAVGGYPELVRQGPLVPRPRPPYLWREQAGRSGRRGYVGM
jgi:hypothetical protein